jgi:hypothetical protein
MKIKRKGCFEYELNWHQNYSALVIPKAAEAFVLFNNDIESFIINHGCKFDFMLRTKVPRSSKLFWGDAQIQNVSRYYVSNSGERLLKVMPPIPKNGFLYRLDKDEQAVHTKGDIERLERKGYERIGEVVIKKERHIAIQSGFVVKICNDIKRYDGDINFAYYIEETKKMVRGVLK